MSRESGGAPGGGGNHNGGVNGGGANSGSSSKGSGGGGKGSGKNDSNSKSSSGSTMSEAAQRSAYSAGRAAAQAMASGNAKASGGNLSSSGKQGGKGGIASRVSSINQTLSSYSQRQSSRPNHNISSVGGPSMYGMHDGSFGGKVKGALGFGPSTNFNDTIKTDNVNGVIGNLQRKAQDGTLTERDRANIRDASGAYNKQAGANIFGGTILGGAGRALAGLVGDVGNTNSYFSGIGRDAARGDFDSERLAGQRGQALGSEGGLDSTLKTAMGLLSGVVPGASQVLSGVASGLTQPASGFGGLLNSLNNQAGNTTNQSSSQSNGSSRDYGAPPRPGVAPSTEQARDEGYQAFRYDPTQYRFNQGQRATEEWRY